MNGEKIDKNGRESTMNTEQPHLIEESFKQVHKTCRHAMYLYVVWFTFFTTLNLGTMGWLARANTEHPDNIPINIVAWAFIILNALGIGSGASVIYLICKAKASLIKAFPDLNKRASTVRYSLAASIYTVNVALMLLGLMVLCVLWLFFFWINL